MWILRTFLLAAVLGGCTSGGLGLLRAPAPTAHGRYADQLRSVGLDSTALGREWLAASDSALRRPFPAALPSRETGVYRRDEARAVAWRVALRDGERLDATLEAQGRPAQLFLDLYEITADSSRPFRHRASAAARPVDSLVAVSPDSLAAQLSLTFEASSDAEFVVRLQPELLRSGRYTVELRVTPQLAFPVEGRGNSAIQSFFGVARDGGARSHQGIDIFAPRGTPVVASTDGIVRSIAPNTLGGNVVWLADPARRQSLYYAHLDRHHVQAGQRVRVGDTLGFVGNTGNARSTAPHLHFGIYRQGQGAIDPLRHVRRTTERPPPIRADALVIGRPARARSGRVPLRMAPVASTTIVRTVSPSDSLQVMGVTGSWYRVQLEDGVSGYVPASMLLTQSP